MAVRAEMHRLPYHRKGTAGGYIYLTIIHPEGTGWGWEGHKRLVGSRGGDPGPLVAFGGGHIEVIQAERAADSWFYGVQNIIELTPNQDSVSPGRFGGTEDRRCEEHFPGAPGLRLVSLLLKGASRGRDPLS